MQKNSGSVMKVGLVLPGNLWFCPYVNIYTEILKKNNIEYEIISWNRDGTDPENATSFKYSVESNSKLDKVIPFIKYIKFIKKTIRQRNYDKLVVFSSQIAILLYSFLKRSYSKKFIFDFRDLSIEQKPAFNLIFKKLLSISSLNVISSPGFKKYLPINEYLISHNFDINLLLENKESSETIFDGNTINILTIGSIRDYEANVEVVKALANKKDVTLHFIGKGEVSSLIEEYVKTNEIGNVFFKGFYNKSEEADLIRKATFLNIYYPKIKSHSSALSNRFYNALLYKRPMIVTANSIQGDYVENYNLGVSVDNCHNLYDLIHDFKLNFNSEKFDSMSNKLLENFSEEYWLFHNKVKQVILEH